MHRERLNTAQLLVAKCSLALPLELYRTTLELAHQQTNQPLYTVKSNYLEIKFSVAHAN